MKKMDDPLTGDLVYSANDDIYNKGEKEPFNEDVLPNVKGEKNNPDLEEDLDIPGAELDDANEMIGEEDEENNYYSLGGDNHINLEEDQGE